MTSKALSSKLSLVGLHFASDEGSVFVTAITRYKAASYNSVYRGRDGPCCRIAAEQAANKVKAVPPVAVRGFPLARADDGSMAFHRHHRHLCAGCTPPAMTLTKHGH